MGPKLLDETPISHSGLGIKTNSEAGLKVCAIAPTCTLPSPELPDSIQEREEGHPWLTLPMTVCMSAHVLLPVQGEGQLKALLPTIEHVHAELGVGRDTWRQC